MSADRSPERKITQRDIAQRAGHSITTVSRALRGSHEVSLYTKRKIQEAAWALGYGSELESSWIVSIVTQRTDDPFYLPVLEQIVLDLQKGGFSPSIQSGENNVEAEAYSVGEALKAKPEVLVLFNPFNITAREIDRRFGRPPAVAINSPEGFPLHHNFVSIDTDFAGAAQDVISHLERLGHKRIAFLPAGTRNSEDEAKSEAFRKAAVEKGLGYQYYYRENGGDDLGAGYWNTKNRLLCTVPRPTAIVASNDEVALGTIRAINERRLTVPGDISVVGFGGIELTQFSNPRLTTVKVPWDVIGKTASQVISEFIESSRKLELARRIKIPTSLVIGESTGSAPK